MKWNSPGFPQVEWIQLSSGFWRRSQRTRQRCLPTGSPQAHTNSLWIHCSRPIIPKLNVITCLKYILERTEDSSRECEVFQGGVARLEEDITRLSGFTLDERGKGATTRVRSHRVDSGYGRGWDLHVIIMSDNVYGNISWEIVRNQWIKHTPPAEDIQHKSRSPFFLLIRLIRVSWKLCRYLAAEAIGESKQRYRISYFCLKLSVKAIS